MTRPGARKTKLPKLPDEPESIVLRKVLDVLRGNRWIAYHTWNSRHSPAGFPDVIAVRGSRLLAIEVKREREQLTVQQKVWLLALSRVPRVECLVIRPSTFDQLLEKMNTSEVPLSSRGSPA